MNLTKWFAIGLSCTTALSVIPATQAAEYQVGAVISLTGVNARGGTGMHEGIKVAESVFNQRGGNVQIKVETINDESSPAKAVAAVERLAANKVVAITGGATSDIVGPAATAADKLGLPFMTSGGTSSEFLTQGFKSFFRINNTTGYVKAMAGLLETMQVKKLAVIYSTKKSTSEMARMMQQYMAEKGVVVTMHPFEATTVDFKPIINKIKLQDKPDAINMIGYENDYVGILRATRVLKPQVKAMVGAWQIATSKMYQDFPDLVDKTYGTEMLPVPVTFNRPEGQAFEAAFRKLYPHEPDYLSQYGFVQGMLLFEAIARAEAAGTLDKGGIAQELRSTPVDTIIGNVRFTEQGDNEEFVQNIGQHQKGNIVIVWPESASTGAMQFPGTPW
ncbi:branched-chain amino acid ABC transporter substrate-binding protein [Chania multitudinisentens RB-25]|uniref:Branched-chain amino acid ABC transporter substrate-binding protein n=1 Tax=Chania multitudinisentens RB-25 TaxID=1441930 RepID=W0LBR5_9GAMM|nr:ABC transporter substrate-binding protein [Chania multitudinisentens]AHG21176.1 branched-chain amino acid ABC transporter substrate-binding protein [Chania multitudinisentens RB-25]